MENGYIRKGKCTRCGACETIDTLPIRIKVYQLFGLSWVAHAAPCPHFYWDDGKATCAIYGSSKRPWMCEAFPASPIDILALPTCGYTFIDGDGRDMMPVLRAIALEKAEQEGFEDVVEFLRKGGYKCQI